MDNLKIIYKKTEDLIPYINNPRNNDGAVDKVASSIKNFGFKVPIVVDGDNEIIAGHTRLKAAKKLGMDEVPCIVADVLNDGQIKAFRLADNRVAEFAEWDMELLESELAELEDLDFDMEDFDFDTIDEIGNIADINDYETEVKPLEDTFVVPPWSVLDTTSGRWQKRKKQWLGMGIKSEVGRPDNMIFSKKLDRGNIKGTSIFDPVLCEVSYRWFGYDGGIILDPFAGGSVRGIVAHNMGFGYTGVDLREEQIEANIKNANDIFGDGHGINWICGNSKNIDDYMEDEQADMIFTCPPYFDLEVYSNSKEDLSNMSYEEFCRDYDEILSKAIKKLKDNRFAVVVISDVRDKKGGYRRLCDITKDIFEREGLTFYNEAILANAAVTAAIRARRNMTNRKLVKLHQNVLVFYKGEIKEIQNNFPILEEIDDYEKILEEQADLP